MGGRRERNRELLGNGEWGRACDRDPSFAERYGGQAGHATGEGSRLGGWKPPPRAGKAEGVDAGGALAGRGVEPPTPRRGAATRR